jgi:hypothetical protein
MEYIKETGPDTAVISLDDLEKFLDTYPNAIGRLRRWCELNGLHFDLSSLFGNNKVLFTTPPAGCFTFTFQYLGRTLDICLYGRNLYVMGWRNPNGTFEIKLESENRKNFMSGEGVTVVQFKKNHMFLAPERDVSKIRLGMHALREAFEVLHKSTGNSYEVRLAVGTFVVHTSEAGRLQGVLKDVCTAALQDTVGKVGKYNRFWIQRYDHYAKKEMAQIDALLHGETPPGIKACQKSIDQGVEISENIILNQIRIFPRDGYNVRAFKHEPTPSDDPCEDDPVFGNDIWLQSSKGEKLATKGLSSKKDRRKVKSPGLEEVPTGDGGSSSAAAPLYLIEDWSSPQEEEKQSEVKGILPWSPLGS